MRYDYLIVGDGMVADAAARGIREVDREGSIGILSPEDDARHLLGTVDDTGADLMRRTAVAGFDPEEHIVVTRSGDLVEYGRLLLAGGAEPAAALAEQAGLALDEGVAVDDRLHASAPDVWASPDTVRLGRAAGRWMAASGTPSGGDPRGRTS